MNSENVIVCRDTDGTERAVQVIACGDHHASFLEIFKILDFVMLAWLLMISVYKYQETVLSRKPYKSGDCTGNEGELTLAQFVVGTL